MTATEAARGFNALLDETEEGETVMITRGGRRIAEIRPAPAGNGSDLIEFAERWRGQLDVEFASDVAAARDAVIPDEDPWTVD